jgi:photosystem II stability/assembly factor-like uncharacterized protein
MSSSYQSAIVVPVIRCTLLVMSVVLALAAIGTLGQEPKGRWEPIFLVRSDQKTAGKTGGEGGQRPGALGISQDGKRMLLGTDAGGVYRSFNAGERWEPCNVGFSPRGAVSVAIDPNNSDRALAVGTYSSPGSHHGLYLSTNFGGSWKHVLPINMGNHEEVREQIAFDPTSYAAGLRRTQRIYWSRIDGAVTASGNPDEQPAIYKTEDGGETWQEIPNSAAYAGSIIRVQSSTGWLFGGNASGLFVSKDRGKSFQWLTKDNVTGLDLNPKDANSIWMSTPREVLRSTDAGKTWVPLNVLEIAKQGCVLRNIKVSPAGADRLVLWREALGGRDWPRFASSDGGRTWIKSELKTNQSFLPANPRQGVFAWHPTASATVYASGGDFVTRSTNGGQTFEPWSEGFGGVSIGGKWNFGFPNSDTIFFGSQGYNGALTKDGGKTWTYVNVSGHSWGGITFGGYSPDGTHLWTGEAESLSGPRMLKLSTDGAKTWQKTPRSVNLADASFASATAWFSGQYRSLDRGKSWVAMPDCDAVLASTPDRSGLLGAKENRVLRSTDSGESWTILGEFESPVHDIAINHETNQVFVVAGDALFRLDNGNETSVPLPLSQFGTSNVKTVAVDPRQPSTVYVGSAANLFNSAVSVLQSRDSGKTWVNLTRQKPLGARELALSQLDGGREAVCVRVHPKLGHLWAATSCYGLWKWIPE